MSLERLREVAGDGYVYLASPYSKYRGGVDEAHRLASMAAATLIENGVAVFCPIAHSHPISVHGGLEALSHDVWLPADRPLMERASALCVLRLTGWGESVGVRHELEWFRTQGRPIFTMGASHAVIEHASPREALEARGEG